MNHDEELRAARYMARTGLGVVQQYFPLRRNPFIRAHLKDVIPLLRAARLRLATAEPPRR